MVEPFVLADVPFVIVLCETWRLMRSWRMCGTVGLATVPMRGPAQATSSTARIKTRARGRRNIVHGGKEAGMKSLRRRRPNGHLELRREYKSGQALLSAASLIPYPGRLTPSLHPPRIFVYLQPCSDCVPTYSLIQEQWGMASHVNCRVIPAHARPQCTRKCTRCAHNDP